MKNYEDDILETVERFERFISSVYEGLREVRKAEATADGTGLPLSDLEPSRLRELANMAAFSAAALYRHAELMRELAD